MNRNSFEKGVNKNYLKVIAQEIDYSKIIVIDIETTGTYRFVEDITSFQIEYTEKETQKLKREFIEWADFEVSLWTKFLMFLKKNKAKIVGHNFKFDTLFLHEKTGVLLKAFGDTLVMAHVLSEIKLGLKELVIKYFKDNYDIDTKNKTGEVTAKLIEYGLKDVMYTHKLYDMFKKDLKDNDLVNVYREELRVYNAYITVESQKGIYLDPNRDKAVEYLRSQYEPIKERLDEVAKINWGSSQQVANVLFSSIDTQIVSKPKKVTTWTIEETGEQFKTKVEATRHLKEQGLKPSQYTITKSVEEKQEILGYGLGLKPKKMTDTGNPSVDDTTLSELLDEHECIKDLREWKRLTKLETMIKGLEKFATEGGYIHPSFNITARTGRTTCKDPNLQQIPQDKNVRNIITVPKGHKLIECFSGDTEVLTEGGWVQFKDLTMHVKVAQYNISTKEITFAYPLGRIHKENKTIYCYEDKFTSLNVTGNHNVLTKYTDCKVKKHKFVDTNFSRANQFINAGYFNNKHVASPIESRFIAMFNADGHMSSEGYVYFSFIKKRKIDRCKYILDTIGVDYIKSTYTRGGGKEEVRFYIGNRLNEIILKYTNRYKSLKWISIFTLDLDEFIDEVCFWDSTKKDSGSYRFTTTNYDTALVTQTMLALRGRKSTIRVDEYKQKKNKNHSKSYYLNISKTPKEFTCMKDNTNLDSLNTYKGDVYCVTMPLGTLVVRHNGKISIQGNCDLSQVELRVAAILSEDENMLNAYNSGIDIHTNTMNLMFGDRVKDADKGELKRLRTFGKISNFGFLYGMTAKKFVDYASTFGLKLSIEESEGFRERYLNSYPSLVEWWEECKSFARTYGYSQTLTGRKRFLPNILRHDFKERSEAERQSINSPVQGFASDFCISAMADIVESKELDHSRFRVLGTVHDAILLEVKEEYAEELGQKVKAIMEKPSLVKDIELPIPMIADVEIVDAWGG